MIRCLCIDDENKPAEVPASQWIKKDEEYHITHFYFCVGQKVHAVDLYERPLVETGEYQHFLASRFAIHRDHWDAFLELVKNCTDLNDFDLEQLLQECPSALPELIENLNYGAETST